MLSLRTFLPATRFVRTYAQSTSPSRASKTSGVQSSPKDHTVNKDHELDVQSHSSKQAMRERANAGGRAPGEKKADPKKDHPNAPEPVIGMQDERGHKDRERRED
ncbi:hypothetical protein FPQ18DRAFT_306204 [Pyronema domesticum]|nr:hypothetical protein FPQ18DRAFT_306204 [Pyronema domesticum]